LKLSKKSPHELFLFAMDILVMMHIICYNIIRRCIIPLAENTEIMANQNKKSAKEAAEAAEAAYPDDMVKADTSAGIVKNFFRRVNTGEIDERDIEGAAKDVQQSLERDYPEAWEGGVKGVFKRFLGN